MLPTKDDGRLVFYLQCADIVFLSLFRRQSLPHVQQTCIYPSGSCTCQSLCKSIIALAHRSMANLLCISKEIFDEIIQSALAFDDAILFVLLEQVAAIQPTTLTMVRQGFLHLCTCIRYRGRLLI